MVGTACAAIRPGSSIPATARSRRLQGKRTACRTENGDRRGRPTDDYRLIRVYSRDPRAIVLFRGGRVAQRRGYRRIGERKLVQQLNRIAFPDETFHEHGAVEAGLAIVVLGDCLQYLR